MHITDGQACSTVVAPAEYEPYNSVKVHYDPRQELLFFTFYLNLPLLLQTGVFSHNALISTDFFQHLYFLSPYAPRVQNRSNVQLLISSKWFVDVTFRRKKLKNSLRRSHIDILMILVFLNFFSSSRVMLSENVIFPKSKIESKAKLLCSHFFSSGAPGLLFHRFILCHSINPQIGTKGRMAFLGLALACRKFLWCLMFIHRFVVFD